MTAIVLIEHNGNIKNVKSKELTRNTLYKKCGFRSDENFERTTTWEVEHNKEMFIIELWAKSVGKANNENKYDFPPPVDNSLYYGTWINDAFALCHHRCIFILGDDLFVETITSYC